MSEVIHVYKLQHPFPHAKIVWKENNMQEDAQPQPYK